MPPQRHDAVFAAISHLPHALAFALVHMIAARRDADELFAQAGAGFRDFTRIASSSPRDVARHLRGQCALAGQGGRTLFMTVCSSQGGDVQSRIVLPGPAPSDRDPSHACQACVLCSAGGDRTDPGPVLASIPVPACSATAEAPVARPCTGPAPGGTRIARARDPPSLA